MHLAEDTVDCRGGVQAQILPHIAIDPDLAAQQESGRVQRASRADDTAGLEHDAPLPAAPIRS